MGASTSRSRYASAPTWSSWPWVRTIPSTSSARAFKKLKSGRTRSTPGISGFGNRTPQSRTTRRPSCSMTAQLRPISPSPPRKAILTGSATGARAGCPGAREAALAPRVERRKHGPGPLVEAARGHAHREAALAGRQPERPQDGLRRDRVRRLVARLERDGVEEGLIELARR